MIFILTSHEHAYTFNDFLHSSHGESLRSFVKIVFYADVFHRRKLPRGTYIFADIERLSPLDMARSSEVARQLKANHCVVLNEPNRVLRRYDLLKVLSSEGRNDFRAFRLNEIDTTENRVLETLHFPVFIRGENDHRGSRTQRIHAPRELQTEITRLLQNGASRDELLVSEYLETADENAVFRKYSSFIIGEEFLPRAIVFSSDWVTKDDDIITTERGREDAAYVKQNPHPHEAELREIFALANIKYGRVDYGLKDGKIQIWEINTNPILKVSNTTQATQFVPRFYQILRNLNENTPSGAAITLQFSPDLRRKLQIKNSMSWILPSRKERLHATIGKFVRRCQCKFAQKFGSAKGFVA